MLNNQKNTANKNPEITVSAASGANFGIKNGTTAEATLSCPRSESILETTLICSSVSIFEV